MIPKVYINGKFYDKPDAKALAPLTPLPEKYARFAALGVEIGRAHV